MTLPVRGGRRATREETLLAAERKEKRERERERERETAPVILG
jgi:hypothetical protein